MNILVTGANGQLGRELRRVSAGSPDRYIFTDIAQAPDLDTVPLDVTDADAVLSTAGAEGVDAIFNFAGYTDVEKAEDEPEAAALLNATVPGSLASVARSLGCTLVHISTDFVFPGDGSKPLREDSPVGPVNVYGRTKLEGERAVAASGCKSIIIRTAWMYSPYGRNFVRSIRRLCSQGKPFRVVSDQTGSPTAAADLAAFLQHLAETRQLGKTGLYHFTGRGAVSRYDFARAVRDLSGSNCRIAPCLSGEYPSKAARPHYSALDCTLAAGTFGFDIPDWHDSLRACIERMK